MKRLFRLEGLFWRIPRGHETRMCSILLRGDTQGKNPQKKHRTRAEQRKHPKQTRTMFSQLPDQHSNASPCPRVPPTRAKLTSKTVDNANTNNQHEIATSKPYLQEVRASAVQHSGGALGKRRGVNSVHPLAPGLHAHELHVTRINIRHERVEYSDSIGTSSDASYNMVRESASHVENLHIPEKTLGGTGWTSSSSCWFTSPQTLPNRGVLYGPNNV